MTWQEHVEKWKECTRCPLCSQRDRIVLARGRVPCDVLFCGEAPGASEDAHGVPFVGPAGHLLDQIIEKALPPQMTYALTNLVACYPREAKLAGENEPTHDEIGACRPRLKEFIEIARPRLIVCAGVLAETYTPLATERIELHQGQRAPKWCHIVHPAAIKMMPLAQRQMATQKCIVVIRTAISNIEVV